MFVLAIESSCDETSAAVVEDGRLVLSNIVASQFDLHGPYGGVVPEIASRQHVRVITQVTERALADAQIGPADLAAIAATQGPGLAGSLLVGLNFARGLAFGLGLPLIPVNHLEGHIHSVWLSASRPLEPAPEMPLLVLIVSGGHTELVLMREHGNYEVVGRTLDDAAGEAFDKVGRLLGLPFPGGPAIQKMAEAAGDPVQVPRAWLPDSLDFSFSGVKTHMVHRVRESPNNNQEPAQQGNRKQSPDPLSTARRSDFAAGFQESVIDVLVTKTANAAEHLDVAAVAVVGGVAANGPLRSRLQQTISRPLFIARPEFSTDNAAMIGSAAYFNQQSPNDIDVLPGLSLTQRPTL